MECARRAGFGGEYDQKKKFQSLFLWNALVERSGTSVPDDEPDVSILVFMECARRELHSHLWGPGSRSFNPCFYGMRS